MNPPSPTTANQKDNYPKIINSNANSSAASSTQSAAQNGSFAVAEYVRNMGAYCWRGGCCCGLMDRFVGGTIQFINNAGIGLDIGCRWVML